MTQSFSVAVVGATSIVGEAVVGLLEERAFPVGDLYLLGGDEAVGQSLGFGDRQVRIKSIADFKFQQADIVFFSGPAQVTKEHWASARTAGCALIDLSAAYTVQAVPVVLADYADLPVWHKGSALELAVPSPTGTAIGLVLRSISPVVNAVSVHVTAMLSASTLGQIGVRELARQTTELLNARPLEPKAVDRQLAFNVLGQLGMPDANGYTELEGRLAAELQCLNGRSPLRVSATCAAVPVFFGDSVSLSISADHPLDLAQINASLAKAPGVDLFEDDYPTAVCDALGQDEVCVGRVRSALGDSSQVNLWIASDNARKGSALNAVQIAELLIKHYL